MDSTLAGTWNDVLRYGQSIWRLRYFWYSLAKMDISTRYRRSFLGIAWSMLNPLGMTVVLCMVFHTMFKMDIATYAPYVLSGMAIWSFFSVVVGDGCNALICAEKYIRAIPAPLPVFALRALLVASFHFMIVLLIALLVAWGCIGMRSPVALLSLAPTLTLYFLFGWASMIVIGIANVIFPDIQHMSTVGLQILFYLTPIFYPPETIKSPAVAWIMNANPLCHFVTLIRDPILQGTFPSCGTFLAALLMTSAVWAVAAWMLAKFDRTLVFYL